MINISSLFIFYLSLGMIFFQVSCVAYRFDELRKFEEKKDVKTLIHVLDKDSDEYIRAQAAQSLGRLKDKRAVPVLIKALLKDKEWTVRYYSAESLGKIRDKRGIKPLKTQLKKEEDEYVIGSIKTALKRL